MSLTGEHAAPEASPRADRYYRGVTALMLLPVTSAGAAMAVALCFALVSSYCLCPGGQCRGTVCRRLLPLWRLGLLLCRLGIVGAAVWTSTLSFPREGSVNLVITRSILATHWWPLFPP